MIEFGHLPVMKDEALEYLQVKAGRVYADLTLGGGSHTKAIAERGGRVIAVDRDSDAIDYAGRALAGFGDKIIYAHDNYANIGEIARGLGYERLDGALMDCGVSSRQLDEAARGFSYMRDAALDMRMDRRQALTAADIVNGGGADELRGMIYSYGEERYTELIVREIIKRRQAKRIETTLELADIIKYAVRGVKYDGGHPAKRTFQAVRIAVNDELGGVAQAIDAAAGLLGPGGRLVAISFHSLEDRVIKQAFAKFAKGCVCPPRLPVCACGKKPEGKLITRKPVYPGERELEQNPRSASAKMRVLEKL